MIRTVYIRFNSDSRAWKLSWANHASRTTLISKEVDKRPQQNDHSNKRMTLNICDLDSLTLNSNVD